MPNLNDYKLELAQKLKDQCKDKEALEILNNIENVDDFTIDEQNCFYLLQSSLFYHLSPYTKALDMLGKFLAESTAACRYWIPISGDLLK